MNKSKLAVYFMFYLVTCVMFFSLHSCKKTNKKDKETIEKWIQKEIRFPQNITFRSASHDTICLGILNCKYKILIYVDSTGCVPCHLSLPEWKTYIDTCKLKRLDVGFLFVVQSNNYLKLEQTMYMQHFNYPIIYDHKDEFNRLNKLPKEERFRTFLLDDKNRVLLIGSPITNIKLRELYNNIICGRKKGSIQTTDIDNNNSLSKNNTNVQIDRDSVDLGRFSFKEIRHVAFQLKNIGTRPLIIQSVSTSCGCTVAKYDKKPITQGEITTVVLEYKPNSLGYFSKTADVVCNVPEGYVKLKISGEVLEK